MANTSKNDIFRSPNLIGMAAIIAFAGLFSLAILGILASVLMIVSPDSNFELPSGETMDTAWFLVSIVALFQLGLRILCIIFFLVWLYRAFNNLPVIGARNLQFSPGWAVGWWFIPFANLVQPYKIVKELYRESHVAALRASPVPSTENVGLWWGMFLTSGFALRVSDSMVGSNSTGPSRYFPVAYLVGQMLFAAASVYVILIIKYVSSWQTEAFRTRLPLKTHLPPPPPIFDHN